MRAGERHGARTGAAVTGLVTVALLAGRAPAVGLDERPAGGWPTQAAAAGAPGAHPEAPAAVMDGSAAPAGEAATGLEPWIHQRMPGRLRLRLRDAFPLAVDRLASRPRCRALFERLGRDPLAVLGRALYYPVSPAQERELCPGKAALTNVGGRQVRICPGFARLAPRAAAAILIHEALHLAGLGEHPLDRTAPTSTEINARVRGGCDL